MKEKPLNKATKPTCKDAAKAAVESPPSDRRSSRGERKLATIVPETPLSKDVNSPETAVLSHADQRSVQDIVGDGAPWDVISIPDTPSLMQPRQFLATSTPCTDHIALQSFPKLDLIGEDDNDRVLSASPQQTVVMQQPVGCSSSAHHSVPMENLPAFERVVVSSGESTPECTVNQVPDIEARGNSSPDNKPCLRMTRAAAQQSLACQRLRRKSHVLHKSRFVIPRLPAASDTSVEKLQEKLSHLDIASESTQEALGDTESCICGRSSSDVDIDLDARDVTPAPHSHTKKNEVCPTVAKKHLDANLVGDITLCDWVSQ